MVLLHLTFFSSSRLRLMRHGPLYYDMAVGGVSCLHCCIFRSAHRLQEKLGSPSPGPYAASYPRKPVRFTQRKTRARLCRVGQKVWYGTPWRLKPLYGEGLTQSLTGDIIHLQIFGQHLVILNSSKAAVEMLDKKSVKYSDRPILPFVGDLLGCKHSLPLLPYGDTFRKTRKRFHRIIGTRTAVEGFSDVESMEIHKFLKRVLADPERLANHIRMCVSILLAA